MSIVDAVSALPFQPAGFEPGQVLLAGAGPGGLGSLTLDVVAALGAADAVVYDALVDPAVLKAAPKAEIHFVGKRAGQPSASQTFINELMVRLASEGKRILRLKGGDPNVFGRGGEEAAALAAAGIPFRFLPGVTSSLGALAVTGIPATLRGVNKAIILATGHGADSSGDLDWAALARTGQPIVVYMGLNNLASIAAALRAGGLADTTPAAVIMAATTPDQRVITADLGTIAERVKEAGMGAPALIVVGEIVARRFAIARASAP